MAGGMGVSRPRLYDRSTFTAYSRSEVDRVRKTVETWCVMVSIIDLVMIDECSGLPTMISPTQEQLAETGSDKLPSFPWDPGVHLVSRMFHCMTTQVAPKSHTLHLGLVWSGSTGTCPMGRDLFLPLDHHDRAWRGTSSTEVSMPDTVSGQQVRWSHVF
jgi:hypothetical protein